MGYWYVKQSLVVLIGSIEADHNLKQCEKITAPTVMLGAVSISPSFSN
jgi:hypothetical protein